MMAYKNLEAVDAATQHLAAMGVHVLQGWLLEESEQAHVERLLAAMNPKLGAVVLDAGCGTGRVADLMKAARPDLEFILLNISERQLEACCGLHTKVLGDFECMPIASASVDAVMLNHAICHGEHAAVLAEAHRVLKADGQAFIYDMVRQSGTNDELKESLDAVALTKGEMEAAARGAGFDDVRLALPRPKVERIRDVLGRNLADPILAGVLPAIWSLRKEARMAVSGSTVDLALIDHTLRCHPRAAMQLSGGRDSTATLYQLRPFWDRIRFYHVDSGDQFPETRAVMDRIRRDVHVEVIQGDVQAVRRGHGFPTDLLPTDNTPLGRAVSGEQIKLIDRYECCWRTIMQPMHQRMHADGITLLIRGQRDGDYSQAPMRSGEALGGFEVLYPIQHWSGDDVERYLRGNGLPVADFYPEGMKRASDCMRCTAWWDDGRAQYLKRFHPREHAELVDLLGGVRTEIARQYFWLANELGETQQEQKS